MNNEPILAVLNDLRNGQLKGERRTAVLTVGPSQRTKVSGLNDLLLDITSSSKQTFTSSVEMIWITTENHKECLGILSSAKALGIEYLAFDDNGHVSYDPYLASLRYISFGISPTRSYIVDLQIIPFNSIVHLLTSKILKLTYDSLSFLGFMKHFGVTLNQVSDLRLLDIILLCGLGNIKPTLSDTISRHLGVEVVFPELSDVLNREDMGLIIATRTSYLFALAEILYPKIRKENLWEVARLEMQSIYPLSEMRYNGMPFSVQKVKAFSEGYQTELDLVASKLHKILDCVVSLPEEQHSWTVNLKSEEQLLRAFRRIGINLPNTHESTLAIHRGKHKAVDLLFRFKQLSNLVENIGKSYLRYLHPSTQRIHAGVNPLGTRTSRIIITKPNLQGIEHGINRKLFKAPPGSVFVVGDYRQIEVFINAFLSKDKRLLDDVSGDEDVYAINARLFLGRSSITEEDRNKVKPTVLGLLYDMTDSGLCRYVRSFGFQITMSEASNWRRIFFERYFEMRVYLDALAQKSRSLRYVTSILNRKRCFDTHCVITDRPEGVTYTDFKFITNSVIRNKFTLSKNRVIYTVNTLDEARNLQELLSELDLNTKIEQADPPLGAVFNGPAQMSCADLIKTALVEIFPYLKNDCRIVLTSHDDIAFNVPGKEASRFGDTLGRVMENASYKLFKPFKAKVKIKIGEDFDI